MVRRRLYRRNPESGMGVDGSDHPRPKRRIPIGMVWIVFAGLILALVIGYDRRAISEAREHISQGQDFEEKGLFKDAIDEYDRALGNKRLGRRDRANVALSIADIYYTHFENYDMAHRYYVQAKQISPTVTQDSETQERVKLAQKRSLGAGVMRKAIEGGGATTQTILQKVELISEPQDNLRGPVVATYRGGEVRAGELLRALRARPDISAWELRQDPKRLDAFLREHLQKTLAYEAALEAGAHQDVDVSAKLYDYQRTLITQRYLTEARQQAKVISNPEVAEYYKAHQDQYVQPGFMTIAMIKTSDESSATEAQRLLRSGSVFGDVASSMSQDEKSSKQRGVVGRIDSDATSLEGVGEAPEILKTLRRMRSNSISSITKVGNDHYIFQVVQNSPSKVITLDEARARIENTLRGQAIDSARDIPRKLNESFVPEIDKEALSNFWKFAEPSVIDAVTSGSKETTVSETSTTAITDAASPSSIASVVSATSGPQGTRE